MRRVARHPAEDLGRGGERADGGRCAARPAEVLRARARRRGSRPRSSAASGRRGASRSARAPSAAPRRARRCRSRRARRRGTRRARRRAARAPRARARAGRVSSSRASGRSGAAAEALQDDGAAEHRRERRAARSIGSCASGSARLTCGRSANTSASVQGRAGSGCATSAAREPLAARDDLQLAVGGADRAGPGARAVHEHAVRERHAAEPDLLPLTAGSVAGARPAAARLQGRGGRRRSGVPSTATTGITSRIDEVVNASSAAASAASS